MVSLKKHDPKHNIKISKDLKNLDVIPQIMWVGSDKWVLCGCVLNPTLGV